MGCQSSQQYHRRQNQRNAHNTTSTNQNYSYNDPQQNNQFNNKQRPCNYQGLEHINSTVITKGKKPEKRNQQLNNMQNEAQSQQIENTNNKNQTPVLSQRRFYQPTMDVIRQSEQLQVNQLFSHNETIKSVKSRKIVGQSTKIDCKIRNTQNQNNQNSSINKNFYKQKVQSKKSKLHYEFQTGITNQPLVIAKMNYSMCENKINNLNKQIKIGI